MAMKHRLVGIVVIIALAMIFIPILMNHSQLDSDTLRLSSRIPKPPPKPAVSLTIPPATQTAPEGLALQRAVEKTPQTEPPALSTIEQQVPAHLQTSKQGSETPVATKTAGTKMPAKKIVPAPAQAWVVQLGTFSSKMNADNLIKKLKTGGYTAYMHESKNEAEKHYTVFVGPTIQRNMAEEIVQKLDKTFNLKGMVVKYKI